MLERAINVPCIQEDSITDLQRQMNPESRTMLPKMAFTGFASRYREPTVDEGFDDITKVNFKVRLVVSCWRCVGMWHILNPASRLAAVCGSQLTSIDSSMGLKRRRPNGASSGYREQSQYARKKKETKLELGSEFPRVHAERLARQTPMPARLPCLRQESRTKAAEARLRWSVVFG